MLLQSIKRRSGHIHEEFVLNLRVKQLN